MKLTKLIALIVLLSIGTARADSHNLTSDAIGNIMGLSNIEYSYKVLSHLTLGIRGTSGKAKLGDYDLKGNSYGLVTRWYQKTALENDSWYFGATIDKENFDWTSSEKSIEFKANPKDTIIGVGGGYHWFWKSFNVGLGAYHTNREKVELRNNQGNIYKDSVDSKLAIELTVGGKF